MKKHQVVALVGTLALLVTLLAPGMAFGAAQSAQQQINCPAGGSFTFARVPKNVTFTPITPNLMSAQSSFDNTVHDGNSLLGGNKADGGISDEAVDNDHLIGVTDTRSGGVGGCSPTSGFSITAGITSTTGGGDKGLIHGDGTHLIYANTVKLLTAQAVAVDHLTTPAVPVLHSGIFYADYPGSGHLYNVTSTGGLAPYAGNSFATEATYGAGHGFSLDGSDIVMGVCASGGGEHNSDIYTGVALGIYQGIGATQLSGTYTGTVTYTANPAPAC